MILILDAYALLAYLEKEPGWEKVESFFTQAVEKNVSLLMTSVNYGEVYYIVLREQGQGMAKTLEKIILTLPLDIVEVDILLAKEAAIFKARGKISYADCFAAALAKVKKGELITGDKEFKSLEKEIKISWL
ncbi:MAG: type II toxin-antitoxin system VapC family toxin [Elusimicrobia bacterium]|nr:type II toxin-antitoxin system VapC family toxin [Elusimicrobiota bacterium]